MADAEDFWPAVEKALNQAPVHAAQDARAGRRASVPRICPSAWPSCASHLPGNPEAGAKVAEALPRTALQRIKSAGVEAPGVEDERLLKEIVYFADRSDISEELTRLQSHFQQFNDCVNSREPVGRTLDFLAQEMNREINTIGSKANDSLISRAVVTLKAELEKFREQAQNVE